MVERSERYATEEEAENLRRYNKPQFDWALRQGMDFVEFTDPDTGETVLVPTKPEREELH